MACSIERAFIGHADVGQSGGGQQEAAGVGGDPSQPQVVGGVTLAVVLRRGLPEMPQRLLNRRFVSAEQRIAGIDVDLPERVALKFRRDVVAALIQHLVAGTTSPCRRPGGCPPRVSQARRETFSTAM